MRVVEEEADGNVGFPQQALQTRVRRRTPAALLIGERLVEVGVCADDGDEGEVWYCVVRRKAIVLLGQRNGQGLRELRTSSGTGEHVRRPLEDLGDELEEGVDARLLSA